MHENLYRLKKNLMKELEEIAESGVSSSTLPKIDMLAHSLKNLCKVVESVEDEESGGSSYGEGMSRRRGGSYDGGSSRRTGRSYDGGSYEDGSYDDGGSYRRKRDSMGRYSRAGMVDHLRDLMEDAPDERTREKLRQMIGELDQ